MEIVCRVSHPILADMFEVCVHAAAQILPQISFFLHEIQCGKISTRPFY